MAAAAASGAVRVQEEEEEPGLVQGDPRDGADEDPELEATKAREREMEEEAAKLKELQAEARRQTTPSPGSREEQMQADARSIYVGNVDYGATAQELEAHFQACGSVNRVTILCDRFSGHPKGFAYVEFSEEESARTALALDESLFRGRQVKVAPKRTNRPGVSSTDRGFPRASFGARFGARFCARPADFRPCPSPFHGAVNSRPLGRVSRGQARGRSSWYSPY